MPASNVNLAIKYVAVLDHVREVSLVGIADLAYWRERLAIQGLVPAEDIGHAQILITTASGKFKGIGFRELSLSVLVARCAGWNGNGAFLVHAFNSNRFFAFCERTFFSTPYFPGDVRLDSTIPASIQLIRGGKTSFAATMGPRREPASSGDDGWEGPVFLPKAVTKRLEPARWFHARIRGHTQRFLFQQGVDELMIDPSGDSLVLQALVDSGFVARDWAVRHDAHHAKSKTYEGHAISTQSIGQTQGAQR